MNLHCCRVLAYIFLQAERTHLQQQYHLLACLAKVWGEARLTALADDGMHATASQLEEQLLKQLTGLHLPKLALSSGCSATSCASCGSTSDDLADDGCSGSDACGSCGRQSAAAGRPSAAACHAHDTSTSIDSSIHQGLQEPACPDSDPFMLLRVLYNQPLDPCVFGITLPELQALWAADVLQLAAYLQQLELVPAQEVAAAAAPAGSSLDPAEGAAACGIPGSFCGRCTLEQQQRAELLEGIKELQLRMFALMQSLNVADKAHLAFELVLNNRLTGERIQEPCKERHKAAIRALQLSPAQQQRLAVGWGLFQRLLDPVIKQRQQLQSEGLKIPGHNDTADRPSTACLASSSALRDPSTDFDQATRLEQQRAQVARLRVVTAKDTMLRGAMATFLQGTLSWVQQARLRVLMVSGTEPCCGTWHRLIMAAVTSALGIGP